jgi:helix-turn-helix resolvase-like protein
MAVVTEERPAPAGSQMELPIVALLLRLREGRERLRARKASPTERFPRVRGDSLPEMMRYRDDGCEINPHCLTCPLPRCRYEEPGGLKGLLNGMRDREIVALRERGMAIEDIADTFEVSKRTVFRILTERYKEVRCA